ncbi:hypothetical protein AYK26_05710 [Euryarchaeota archaeon SM23-78]|nr:MAG: hypothetical protein AYK26_05710 [Euryarchaeota archaeon SM23-78]MBW3000996.1 50S ribosomal protein L21e [Candidatus Woesearchaeota archaeon]
MVQRIGGSRRKTRHKLKRAKRIKGKLSLRKYLEEYKPGERVVLKADSIVQKGLFHPKFIGKTGVVSKKLGSCYEVVIKEFRKHKKIVVHPVHMKRC